MHDIRRIREAPEAFDAMLARRGLAALSEEILSLDRRRRAAQTAFQEMQAGRNALSKRIGAARGKGEDTAELQAEAASMADVIAAEEAEEKRLGAELDALLATIPNWIDDAVPPGASEADNAVLRSWGEARRFDVTPLQHFELGERLGLMDFEAAGRIGARRTLLTHMSHDLEHVATNAALPAGVELAYDGLRVPLT